MDELCAFGGNISEENFYGKMIGRKEEAESKLCQNKKKTFKIVFCSLKTSKNVRVYKCI